MTKEISHKLALLYKGRSRRANVFRYGLITFDIATVVFFLLTTFVEPSGWIFVLDIIIGVVLAADYTARLLISKDRLNYALDPIAIADLLVICSLLAPAFIDNLAFLRILRAMRLIRSFRVLRQLRQDYRFFKRNEDVIQNTLNLIVFIFIVSAFVYVFQVHVNPQILTYTDALYFTVTTLTTTGFGDITLQGGMGRLVSILIMVFGVALFLRLAQSLFRPPKVRYECPSCGLMRHDPDAIHCKHCGEVVHIESEGD